MKKKPNCFIKPKKTALIKYIKGERRSAFSESCEIYYDTQLAQQKNKVDCEGGDSQACYLFAWALEGGTSFFSHYKRELKPNISAPPKDSDYPQAIIYYERGCDLGYALACHEVARIYAGWEQMPPTQENLVKKDPQKAIHYAKKGCDMNTATSPCSLLGFFYKDGLGLAQYKDYQKALEYWHKSCEMKSGANESCLEAGDIYLYGGVWERNDDDLGEKLVPFVKKDELKAMYYFERGNVCDGFLPSYCEMYRKLKKKHSKGAKSIKK